MDRYFLFLIGAERHEQLRQGARLAGCSMAEMLRRMVDHCSSAWVMDHIVPSHSGQFPPSTLRSGG